MKPVEILTEYLVCICYTRNLTYHLGRKQLWCKNYLQLKFLIHCRYSKYNPNEQLHNMLHYDVMSWWQLKIQVRCERLTCTCMTMQHSILKVTMELYFEINVLVSYLYSFLPSHLVNLWYLLCQSLFNDIQTFEASSHKILT